MHPPDHWYQAIEERHSYRSYDGKSLEAEKLSRLKRVCADHSLPGARAAVIEEPFQRVSRGIVGAYGKIDGAPAYLAFVGDTNREHYRQLTGYVGEGLILEAVSLGLSTCWVGGFFYPDMAAGHLEIKSGERIMAVSPLGYRRESLTRKDRLFKAAARSRKRKPLAEITNGLDEDEWPDWIRLGLEAARFAPSAANRQPWRFHVEPRAVTISIDSGKDDYRIPKRLDCGIAMLHFELGARHAGLNGSWMMLELPAVTRFTAAADVSA